MRALHLIKSLALRSHGVGSVALNLAHEQAALDMEVTLWCQDRRAEVVEAARSVGLGPARVLSFTTSGPARLGLSRDMERAARGRHGLEIDVVHQHGLWTGVSRVTQLLGRRRIPTVVATHGFLEEWALRRSRVQKRLALLAYERRNLEAAACLHACSVQELEGMRRFGLRNPVAVIESGVGRSWLASSGRAKRFTARHHVPAGVPVLLYLSRIAPVKGLTYLVGALARAELRERPWSLVIVGADEEGYEARVRAKLREVGLNRRAIFTGALTGSAKRDAFAAATLFVLPTLRENFGIVVAEALGAGVPVITTHGAPWSALEAARCGWWVERSEPALVRAIDEALAMSAAERAAAGARGRSLVERRYTWAASAAKSRALYSWLRSEGTRPDFVETVPGGRKRSVALALNLSS